MNEVEKTMCGGRNGSDDETKTVYIGSGFNATSDDRTVYMGKHFEETSREELEEQNGRQNNPDDKRNSTEKWIETEEKISYYLPINSMLQKRYRIDSILGEGGFGITYFGWDVMLNTPVAIKEYYPTGVVTRSTTLGQTSKVVAFATSKFDNQFQEGIDKVLEEARRLARFRNTPGIVGIYDFFKENNTAYIVMEYVKGRTLDVYCKENRVDCTTLFNMLVPLMDALQAMHEEGLIHRDISPDNIMVDENGSLKLLDFGASRGYSEKNSITISVILKKSYAPEEQFRLKGVQGPWTDVYALGATIYELITGQTPPTSIDRLVDDEIVDVKDICTGLTRKQADVIMRALSVKGKERWQSINEFKTALLEKNEVDGNRTKKKSDNSIEEERRFEDTNRLVADNITISNAIKRYRANSNRIILFIGIAIVCVIFLVGVTSYNRRRGDKKIGDSAGQISEMISVEKDDSINIITNDKQMSSVNNGVTEITDKANVKLDKEGSLSEGTKDDEYTILDNGIVVSHRPAKFITGKYQIVDAALIEEGKTTYTVSFKIKTIASSSEGTQMQISCLDKNGFSIKDIFLYGTNVVGAVGTDSTNSVPKDTAQIVLKSTEPYDLSTFDLIEYLD